MGNTVLITAATVKEMECLDIPCAGRPQKEAAGRSKGAAGLYPVKRLTGGIGPVATVYSLMDYLAQNDKPRLIINIGIAGSFRASLPPGTVVVPLSDCFADLGVGGGAKFIPVAKSGITGPGDEFTPSGSYTADKDIIKELADDYPLVRAITVNTASGSNESAEVLISEFNPDIESMEGAAVYYVCNKKGIPCVAFRAVSNMVGPRDRSLWNISLALDKLGASVSHYLKNLSI